MVADEIGILRGVSEPLARKAREIVAACGSRVISGVRHTYVAGTHKISEHWHGRAVDIAGRKAKSNSEESKRDSGSGSITIDGNPHAQAQARCIVSGVRAGIDGEYRITSVTHSLTRSGGWTTSLELKQPQGSAGKDARKKS